MPDLILSTEKVRLAVKDVHVSQQAVNETQEALRAVRNTGAPDGGWCGPS